jgi:Protein of unknown function (DUF4232)
MKYLTTIPKISRRATAAIAAAAVIAAGLIAASAAVATGSSGAVLAADSSHAAPAAVRACTADDLGVWLAVAQLDGAAGSAYYPLQFTNLSRHACAMRGFAGVSAVDRNLHQLGSPAGRAHVVPVRTVVLAPGRTAHAVLRYGDVTVSTAPGCHPTFRTFELRVYPPGQYHATYAAFDFEVCSHAGPVYMDIGPLQAGVGTRF